MTRAEINESIIRILETGNHDSREDGNELARLLNRLVYMHSSGEPYTLADAKLPKRILMQFCAFNIPRNLSNLIAEYLGV